MSEAMNPSAQYPDAYSKLWAAISAWVVYDEGLGCVVVQDSAAYASAVARVRLTFPDVPYEGWLAMDTEIMNTQSDIHETFMKSTPEDLQ